MIVCSQFTGFLWLYGDDFHASFDRYSCIKPVFSHTNIYWTKKLNPLESIQEFVLCHYHHNKSGQNFHLLLSVCYHSTFETCTQINWNAICMRLRNLLLKQLYLWVICYHYYYQKITVQIRVLGLWYLHLIWQVFSVPSVTALYIWHTVPLRHEWIYLLCQYGALSLSLLYKVTVISLELFGYFICLNFSSEFHLLSIQYFSTWPIYWQTNRMQKLHQSIIFFIWNFFNNYNILFHTGNWHNCPSEHYHWKCNFTFFEWKLGVSLAPLISLKITSYILMQLHSKMSKCLVLFWIQERTWWIIC